MAKHSKGNWKYDGFSYIHADPRGWFPVAQAERLAKEVVVVPRRLLERFAALTEKDELTRELVLYLNGEPIGEVRGWGRLTGKMNKTPEEACAEQDANGYLMSAAPDLKEALLDACRMLGHISDTLEGSDKKEAEKFLALADKAIRKSNGD